MNDSVYILGGGPSMEGFDFTKLIGKEVITVNKSILDYPNAKYFITMDFSLFNKIDIDLNACSSTKIFIANFTFDYVKEINGSIVDTRFNLVYDLKNFDMIIKSRRKNFFGLDFNSFANGQNSAFCALQLAIILGYKNIYLLGIDLNCEGLTHYHGGYGQDPDDFRIKLEEYYEYFSTSIEELKKYHNVNIFNCSNKSRLNNILEYKEI